MATRLYGILWRWHFLAGLVACPVLLVLAVTGAAYVFQPELERAAAPARHEVEPRGQRRGVDALAAALPASCPPSSLIVDPDPRRTVEVWCATTPARRVYLDPYRGAVVGEQVPERSFFGIVLELHRALLLGDRGRLATEWATSWAILLLASGAYLWWPRGRRGGVWWPRRGVSARQRLRDLHAIAGAYAAPALLAISATGLFWTQLAGDERWARVATDEIARTWYAPPTSTPAEGAARIGYDAAIAATGIDRGRDPRAIQVGIGAAPDAAYLVFLFEPDHATPWRNELVWIDAYAGTTLRRLGWDDRHLLGKVNDAGYAIHVGAIGRLPGKLLALAAALVLAGACITGPWMWWKRRPRGALGVPPRARRAHWGLLALLGALAALLPLVGWTLLVLLAAELALAAIAAARRRARSRRS